MKYGDLKTPAQKKPWTVEDEMRTRLEVAGLGDDAATVMERVKALPSLAAMKSWWQEREEEWPPRLIGDTWRTTIKQAALWMKENPKPKHARLWRYSAHFRNLKL